MNDEIRMSNDELPEGWALSTVDGLIGTGGIFADGDWVESKDQDPKGSIRLLQLADIGNGVFVDKSYRFINEEKFVKLRCTEVLERDILIARMPDPLGRACMAPKLKQRCITVVDIAILRPGKHSVLPECLIHFINSPDIRDFVEREATGSTRKRIARGKLNDMELPIPPLPEQKRIADKLEAVLGRVDACRARLDRVPALLKRFRQSVLASATSGGLTVEWRMTNGVNDEWEKVPLGSVVDEIKNGLSPKPKEQPPGTPILRISSVRTFQVYQSDIRYLPPSVAVEPYRLRIGDLLFTRYNGSLEFVGVCGLVRTISVKGLVYPDKLIRVRVNKARVLPDWIEIAANSPQARDVIENKARTSAGQTGISGKDLKELLLPIPSLPEQQEIVRRVEDLFAFADRIESRLATAQKTVERLTPATLAKAFRGELVPQDPTDEPASILLERLTSQPAAKPARATRKAPK